MSLWWDALSSYEKSLWMMAIPATFLFIVQTAIAVFIDGNGDIDSDLDTDFEPSGLELFSIRNGISFLMVFGWTSIAFAGTGVPRIIYLPIAFICGSLIVLVMASVMRFLYGMASSGTYALVEAINRFGTVSVTIPGNRNGIGKVFVNIREQTRELSAIADDEIKVGRHVTVLDVIDNKLFVLKIKGD